MLGCRNPHLAWIPFPIPLPPSQLCCYSWAGWVGGGGGGGGGSLCVRVWVYACVCVGGGGRAVCHGQSNQITLTPSRKRNEKGHVSVVSPPLPLRSRRTRGPLVVPGDLVLIPAHQGHPDGDAWGLGVRLRQPCNIP